MEELKKNRWTFSEKYTCKKQFECLRRGKHHVRGDSMVIKDYKYDLEFFYSNLLNHPAFLTGDKKQTEFQILFGRV